MQLKELTVCSQVRDTGFSEPTNHSCSAGACTVEPHLPVEQKRAQGAEWKLVKGVKDPTVRYAHVRYAHTMLMQSS